LLQLPSSNEPVLSEERSFLFTAAGQFRIYAGFPFQSDLSVRHHEVKLTITRARSRVNIYILGYLCNSPP